MILLLLLLLAIPVIAVLGVFAAPLLGALAVLAIPLIIIAALVAIPAAALAGLSGAFAGLQVPSLSTVTVDVLVFLGIAVGVLLGLAVLAYFVSLLTSRTRVPALRRREATVRVREQVRHEGFREECEGLRPEECPA